jgi:hypothetical protein
MCSEGAEQLEIAIAFISPLGSMAPGSGLLLERACGAGAASPIPGMTKESLAVIGIRFPLIASATKSSMPLGRHEED